MKEVKRLSVVTKDDYKRKVILTTIILCWIILIACFVVKLFGGNFFNIVCNNERFIRVCKWIDNHLIVLLLLEAIMYFIGTFVYLLGCCKYRLTTKKKIIIAIITIFIDIAKSLLLFTPVNRYVLLSIEAIALIITPMLFGTKWWLSILFYLMINAFSIISGITKDIVYLVLPDYSLIALIFLIDYYIMILLFFLYREQIKRSSKNG